MNIKSTITEPLRIKTELFQGLPGPRGLSAYELAVSQGFEGTLDEYLESLHGPKGNDSTVPGPGGADAYQVAVAEGFEGTRAEWLASLQGPPGPAGFQLVHANRFDQLGDAEDSTLGVVISDPDAARNGVYLRLGGAWVLVAARSGGTAPPVIPEVSIAGAPTVVEGQPMQFTVSADEAPDTDVTVGIAWSGSAVRGTDYTAPDSVTIPAGQTSATITVDTIDDALVESSETVVATLQAGDGYTLGTDTATGTITDNDTHPVASITGTPTATEGSPLLFAVQLNKAAPIDTVVALNYGGSAVRGTDYTAPDTITVPAGQTSAQLSIATIDDSDVESSETVVVGISSGSGYTVGSPASATGTITDNDVAPEPVPTPDGPMEAAISPPPTTRRSTYSATKMGVIQPRPSWMTDGGNGVYWGDQCRVPSLAYPDRILNYYSTDHAEQTGGIGITVCVANPLVAENWKSYDDAVAAGWLADIPNLPAQGAPLFQGFGGPGYQYETPCVNRVGNEYLMTYQATNVPGARNQATLMAVSPNGVTGWTGTHTPLMQVSNTEVIGDGHMGYMRWGPNPFPRDLVPFDYIGYSSVGGQSRSTQGMWGSNAPKTSWTFLGAVGKASGRVTPSSRFLTVSDRYKAAILNVDVKSIRATRQGYAALCEFAGVGSGATARPGEMYEVLLDATGKRVIARPQLVIPRGTGTDFDAGEAATGSMMVFADKVAIVYNAANSSNAKVGALAVSPLLNPANTWFNYPSPAIPPASKITTKVFDFRGASAMPSGLTVVRAGTTLPDPAFSADGMAVTADGTMATKGEFYVFEDEGFDPLATEYVDVYVEGLATISAAAFRHFYIGFSATKSLRSAMTDGLWIGTGETTTATMGYQALIAGAQPVAGGTSEDYWGVGYGTSAFDTMARPKKNIGVRIYPKDGLAYILGEGGVEQQEFKVSNSNMLATFDKSKRYYAFYGVRGTDTSAATERLAKMTVRTSAPAKPAGAATLGQIDTKSTSTGGNAPTGMAALNIGAAAADRVVAFYVYGRAAGDVTDLSASFIPDGGSSIPLTRVRFDPIKAPSPATNFIALFVASIPAGTSGVIRPVATAPTAVARWGVKSVAMYGTKLQPDSVAVGSFLGLNAPHSVAIDKFEGGVSAMATMHSTSGSTLHAHAAEETLFDSQSQEIEVFPQSNAAYAVIGLRNVSTPVQIQNTNSQGAVTLAASWKPAA